MPNLVGRGTKYEYVKGKTNAGIGKLPSSNKNPIGKGQGVINKTGSSVYKNNTGVVKKGMK